jgi:DNA-binding HxlR family transcriptional regulator
VDFRYPQFCPLARAAEIVGERWTLLIVRELLLGPRRFSDLQPALSGVSSSVLAERLARLEARGVVRRRELPPPAAASVYELSEAGAGLLPAVAELARWGVRFLGVPRPDDHFEPAWLPLGLRIFARRGASPARSFHVRVRGPGPEVSFVARGGESGTRIEDPGGQADVSLEGEGLALLGLAAGALDPREALAAGRIEVSGDAGLLADFPALFEMSPEVKPRT